MFKQSRATVLPVGDDESAILVVRQALASRLGTPSWGGMSDSVTLAKGPVREMGLRGMTGVSSMIMKFVMPDSLTSNLSQSERSNRYTSCTLNHPQPPPPFSSL